MAVLVTRKIDMPSSDGVVESRCIEDLQLLHGAGAVLRHYGCTVRKGNGLGKGLRSNCHDEAQPDKKANHRCSPSLRIFKSMACLVANAIASGLQQLLETPPLSTEPEI
jgi:hypothetical protein